MLSWWKGKRGGCVSTWSGGPLGTTDASMTCAQNLMQLWMNFPLTPAGRGRCPQCRRIPSSQQHLLFASLLEDGHSALCEGAGACSFDWHSSDSDAEHLLCALRPLDAFFREMFIYIFGIIFCWVGFFFFSLFFSLSFMSCLPVF